MLKKKLEGKLASAQTSSHSSPEVKPRRQIHFSGDKPTFPYSLLESNLGQTQSIDQNFIVEKAKSLEKKLMEFGIPVSIEGFDIGPSVVQIKIKPSEGIKISSIENLTNDIKLSLKSKSLRIIAPIP
jgi:S-DNA-T family DNA segregation ATPase FtsK/SpoIIIE